MPHPHTPARVPWNLNLAPLLHAAGTTNHTHLALLIGVNPRTVTRWATVGIGAPAAERAAIAIGSHPRIVWPALAYELAEELHHAAKARACARTLHANARRRKAAA